MAWLVMFIVKYGPMRQPHLLVPGIFPFIYTHATSTLSSPFALLNSTCSVLPDRLVSSSFRPVSCRPAVPPSFAAAIKSPLSNIRFTPTGAFGKEISETQELR